MKKVEQTKLGKKVYRFLNNNGYDILYRGGNRYCRRTEFAEKLAKTILKQYEKKPNQPL